MHQIAIIMKWPGSRISYGEVIPLFSGMAARQNRLTLKGFSDFHYKWGRLWAFAKNRSFSRLIVDVFELQVEANREEIEKMIRDVAEQRGLTYEELVEQILRGSDDDE